VRRLKDECTIHITTADFIYKPVSFLASKGLHEFLIRNKIPKLNLLREILHIIIHYRSSTANQGIFRDFESLSSGI